MLIEHDPISDELVFDTPESIHNRYKPGSYGCHELVDRIYVLYDTLDSKVLDHPSIDFVEGWRELAQEAFDKLMELYRIVAIKHHEFEFKADRYADLVAKPELSSEEKSELDDLRDFMAANRKRPEPGSLQDRIEKYLDKVL